MKQTGKELPGMPENTELHNLCDGFLEIKNEIEDKKHNLSLVAGKIMEEMKNEKRTALIFENHKFEIVKKEPKIKVTDI